MKGRYALLSSIVLLVILAGLLILAFPHLASAYYLEVGGRALERGEAASAQLRQAVTWDPQNAQAHRLLAQAMREQGELSAAVEALERYIQLRPDNPFGHMQLAETLEEQQNVAAAGQDLTPRILAEWRKAGFSVEDLLHAGEIAREGGLYDQAMAWYQRALLMDPGLGDPWYYIGLAHANQQQWDAALEAFERAFATGRLAGVGRGDLYYQQGTIYQRNLQPPQPERAFSAYQSAVEAGDFTSRADAAWAHARLGQLYYSLQGDFSSAEREILLALEMAPDQRWIYVVAGDLYQQAGETALAQEQYEQALFVSPGFEAAQERLDALR